MKISKIYKWEDRISIKYKFLLSVTILVSIVTVALSIYIHNTSRESTIKSTQISALETINQYKMLRSYYTENVIKKVKLNSNLNIHFNHRNDEKTIPLPATMIHDLSNELNKDGAGVQLRLYSEFPFPNRRQRMLDDFGKKAIETFKTGTSDLLVKEFVLNQKNVLRVAIPDRMVAQACVDCHNTHPNSPKTDWQLGDVRGVLEVISPVDSQLQTASTLVYTVITSMIVLIIVTMLGVYFLIGRKLFSRFGQSLSLANRIASGDVTAEIEADSNDEVGRLMRAMCNISYTWTRSLGLVKNAAKNIMNDSSEISDSSQSLAACASRQASSIQEITAAITQLSGQTKMNASNATDANKLSSDARASAQHGNIEMDEMLASMVEIQQSGKSISKVIKAIDEIAFQTNLLALNAAVEAARAGTHGKGFAVVADEVRNLAVKSADATKQTNELITDTINKVEKGRNIANNTAAALSEIVSKVDRVSMLVDDIEKACTDQANQISEIKNGVSELDRITQKNAGVAEQSASATSGLRIQGEELLNLLSQFKIDDTDQLETSLN